MCSFDDFVAGKPLELHYVKVAFCVGLINIDLSVLINIYKALASYGDSRKESCFCPRIHPSINCFISFVAIAFCNRKIKKLDNYI